MANLIPQGGMFSGLDRLNQALDQRAQNAMALSQMQETKRRNAMLDEYSADDRTQRDQSREAQNFTLANMPFIQGQPDMYAEQSGVLMQDLARQYPQADLSGSYKTLADMQPKEEKPVEYDILQDSEGNYQYIPKRPGTPTMPTGIKGKMAKERPGMALEVGPDGTVMFSEGGVPLSRGTTAKTEQDILDTNDALQRLSQIESSFKPEYLTVPYKTGQAVNAGYEKLGGKLSPEQKQSLGEYTDFRQKGMELLNEEIKRMTGAAITKQEEPRLRASMPDPQNDSPTEYKRKYDLTISSLKMALARKNFAMRKGVTMGNIPLNDMTKVINKRGQELESELGNRIKDKSQLQREVQIQLSREFGI